MRYVTTREVNGQAQLVQTGDVLTVTGSALTYIYQYATRPTEPGKSGKVVVSLDGQERELYATIFGLRVWDVARERNVPGVKRNV